MKKTFLLLTFIIFSNCFLSIGQETNFKNLEVKDSLNNSDFLKAKEGYLKMSLSEDYIKLREASITFAIKVGNRINLDVLKTEKDIIDWITENYQLTQFKDAEEGCNLVRLTYRLQEKLDKEYKEILELAAKGSFAQKKEIYKPEFGTESDTEKIRTEKQSLRNN
jgi:hypothetical protein